MSDGCTREGASMIVGSGQFCDGYGNARVHKYSPDGAARIGAQAGHPNLVAATWAGPVSMSL